MDTLDEPAIITTEEPRHRSHPALRSPSHIAHALATKTNGTAGATTRHGLKVGPNTLAEVLCSGTISAMIASPDTIEVIDTTTTTIPPRVRDHVWKRDVG